MPTTPAFSHLARRALTVLLIAFGAQMTAHAGQVDQGRDMFKQCVACHSTTPGETRFGPSLAGIVGRPAGRLKGYEFSDELHAVKFKWDAAHLQQWLEDEPKNMVPGTRMEFPGISNPADLKALIAYLETLKAK